MSKLRDALDAVLHHLEARAIVPDFHMRADEATELFRVALLLLAHAKEPSLAQVLFAAGERSASVARLTEKIRGEERARLIGLLGKEANRIFNKQAREYPSNVLDVVAASLREGKDEELTVMPEWMARQRSERRPFPEENAIRCLLEVVEAQSPHLHTKMKEVTFARDVLARLEAERTA